MIMICLMAQLDFNISRSSGDIEKPFPGARALKPRDYCSCRLVIVTAIKL